MSALTRARASALIPACDQTTPLALALDRQAGRVLVRVVGQGTRSFAARVDFCQLFQGHGRRCWREGERCWSVPIALRRQVVEWAALHYSVEETWGWAEVSGEEDHR